MVKVKAYQEVRVPKSMDSKPDFLGSNPNFYFIHVFLAYFLNLFVPHLMFNNPA